MSAVEVLGPSFLLSLRHTSADGFFKELFRMGQKLLETLARCVHVLAVRCGMESLGALFPRGLTRLFLRLAFIVFLAIGQEG